MIRRPPRSTRTDTLFPYTTLFRSEGLHRAHRVDSDLAAELLAGFLSQERGHRLQGPLRKMPLRFSHKRALRGAGEEARQHAEGRSEEHTSELPSLMRTSYAVFCLKKKTQQHKLSIKHTTKRTMR